MATVYLYIYDVTNDVDESMMMVKISKHVRVWQMRSVDMTTPNNMIDDK